MTIKLEDIIDIEQFQMLQDRLNEIYSFPSAIIDLEGNILTATAWQDVCTKFHRPHPECLEECIKSDQYILSHLDEANPAVSYKCPHGLIDNATPVIINGTHYGNFFTGQFFLDPPDMDFFRAQAERYGFNEEEYLDAVKKVPIWSQEQLDSYLFFIKGLIEVISGAGLKSIKEIESRKKIEESEAYHRSILQTAMDGVWLVDMQGRLLEVNDAYCRMSGFSEQELLTMSISDLDALELTNDTAARIRDVMAKGEDRFETRHRRKDGSIYDVEASVQYRPTDGGRMIVFMRDITERKQAEEALRDSEERYRQLFDTSPDGVVLIGPDGCIARANITQARMYRYESPEDLIGVYAPQFISISSRELAKQVMQRRLNGEEVPATEYELLRKDGTTFFGETIATILRDRNGTALGYICVTRDISERKREEDRIRQNERWLSGLVNILQRRAETVQQFLDNALNEILAISGSTIGYIYFYHEDRQEFVLNSWSQDVMKECTVTNPHTCYALDKTGIWGEAVRQRKTIFINDYTSENPLKKGYPEGHVHLRKFMTVPVFSNNTIVAVVGVANKPSDYDQTDELQLTLLMDSVWKYVENRKIVEERSVLEAQLHQAQKMESVGRLAGGVAHDFNNMLGVIIGHTELALMNTDPSLPLHSHLVEINSAAERSAALTRQLLAFARKQTIAPKVIDLNDTIAAMFKMLQRLIGEDVHLNWQPGNKLWPVNMDPSQIDQILANLCVNARDAIDNNGKIFIETSNVSIDKMYCESHSESTPGDYVRLTVSDNGHGMDADTLAHIYEPFYSTKELGKGTGLGLATVYGIIKQNIGFINVYSEPEHGTTFTIHIPRHSGETDQAQIKNVSSPPRGHETILMVEDEPSILKLSSMILESLGYKVLKAGNPLDAIRIVREYSGEIHLLMTDVIMPEMNGLDLSRQLMTTIPQLRSLFMSGYTSDIIARHGVIEGGINFIQKPFSLPALASKVRDVLDCQ